MKPDPLSRLARPSGAGTVLHTVAAVAAVAMLALAGPLPAWAQYQCSSGAGVVYQQLPCAAGQQERLLAPGAAGTSAAPPSSGLPRSRLQSAGPLPSGAGAGPVSVGMTQSQVLALLGAPDRTRTVQDGAIVRSHWGFHRERRQMLVVLEDGIVRAVQADEGEAPPWAPAPQPRVCASAAEVRDLEIEISKFQNRDNPFLQQDLQRRLADARACR